MAHASAYDYTADWPELVTAVEYGTIRARVVKARTYHRCEVAGLDLGTAPRPRPQPLPGG